MYKIYIIKKFSNSKNLIEKNTNMRPLYLKYTVAFEAVWRSMIKN